MQPFGASFLVRRSKRTGSIAGIHSTFSPAGLIQSPAWPRRSCASSVASPAATSRCPARSREAVRAPQETGPARVLPRAPLGSRWGIVLSLFIGGLPWAYPPQLYDAPLADLDATPRRGPAPLEVFFQDGSIGAIDEFL